MLNNHLSKKKHFIRDHALKTSHAIIVAVSLVSANVLGPVSVAHALSLIQSNGDVKLKRGNSDFRPARTGERLEKNDILLAKPGVIAKVYCDDGKYRRLPAGLPTGINNVCPTLEGLDTVRKGKLDPRPGGINPEIPYVISPRMTYVLNDRPALRWNKVAGATRYTVGLHGSAGLEWQADVNSTMIQYPRTAPTIERGVRYRVTVRADNGRTSLEDGGAYLGFQLLNQERVKEVESRAAVISASKDLTDEAKILALADLYSNQYLQVEAISLLEELTTNGRPSAIVYQNLGELYASIGLNLLARSRYSKALELFSGVQDQESITETQTKLAKLRLNTDGSSSGDQIITPGD